MAEIRKKKRKALKKPVEVQNEIVVITVDDEEINNTRQFTNEYVGIREEQDELAFNNEETNNRLQLTHRDREVHDGLEEETLDQNQMPIAFKYSNNTKGEGMKKKYRVVEAALHEAVVNAANNFNDISANIGPIVGYADQPLLPLYKACAPLNEIVENISFYVQLALDETPEIPPGGMTIDESAAIRLYTIEWEGPHRSLYSMLNRTLKTGNRKELQPYFKYMKLFVTALAKIPCDPPATVWRGVTKDLSQQFPAGTPVTWWAFTSCTTNLTVLENNMYLGNAGSRTLFSVEAINGRSVRVHSHFDTEDEILLLPGTHMIVQSRLSPAPDLHIIHLKQVIPDEVLLEPPFEGILLNITH
ncbi:unnamed protein product [Rotaria magnacalcarata]|uniref:NAD(P)(+)--arginine ADP-ribosyltransferase n=1 Tax=Rotaria magnacalcarata TaxID=392030 RepID=A0A816Z611_9BILA|nr:unnamed protein product [Rotaria magnacalcarata]